MLKVSVSGVRGIVGKSLTPRIVFEFSLAFGTLVKGGKVVVGRDTRTTGKFLKGVVVRGLASCGCEVLDLSICPTPTTLLIARNLGCNGIVITASHNPAEWNGLKFVRKDGTFLNKGEMESLFSIYKNKKFNIVVDSEKITNAIIKFDKAIDFHIGTVIKNINRNIIRRKSFRIACDFCNGAGAVITKKFLQKLGCKVYTINDKPDGRFAHNPEPAIENLKSLERLVKSKKADFGLAQDPDADRLALCDEKGTLMSEENTLSLAAKSVFMRRKGKIVVNISTSQAMDEIAKEFGVKLFRTPVGEINVVEKMKKVKALIGGEGNGGVIYPKINFCRDSFVGIGLIMEYMAKTGKTLSELTNEIPQYKMIKGKLDCPLEKAKGIVKKLKDKFKGEKMNLMDGIKVIWPKGWIHVRPSNTEPIIRIMAEAKTAEEAKKLYKLVEDTIIKER